MYTTTDGTTFTTTTAPTLISAEAKAAAYYPWADGTDITAVPVTTAAQTDYMYSGWYTGLKDSNPQAKFNMKHALTAVRIGVQKSAAYTLAATLTAVKATSDAFHASATLDATSSTGTLSGLTGPGAVLEQASLNQALSTSPYTTDFLVVPGTSAETITFTVTIGGSDYTATTAAVTLQQGAIHSYTLTLSAEGLAVTNTTVEPWVTLENGDLTLKKNPWDEIENGVYAVSATGDPVIYDDANESCIGVALIVNDAPIPQRLMIEKNGEANTTSIKAAYDADGATSTGYKYFYWGMYGSDIASITNYTQTGGGGTSLDGYLPQANGSYYDIDGTKLSGDYTTWTSGALSDFSGKANTAALQAASDTDSSTTYANMGTYCTKFNETPSENQGYTDWYIPACGQLSLILLNRTDINAALTKIGGTTLASDKYWSSSENSANYGWIVDFFMTSLSCFDKDMNVFDLYVRLIRDL